MTRTRAIIACALVGAAAGLLQPTLQDAVQVAQVQSGTIAFGSTDPFFVMCMQLWSLQHEVPAWLLRAGVTALTLSVALSVVMGALSSLAIGVTSLAAGARPVLAIAASAAVLTASALPATLTYPLWLLGSNYTWGAIGLAWVVSAMGLVASGYPRIGALALGVGLAVHPVLAAIGILGLLVAAAWHHELRRSWRAVAPWFVAGVAVSALSLAVHEWRVPVVAAADRLEGPTLARAVLDHWDVHRQPTPFRSVRWLMAVVVIGVAAATALRRSLDTRARAVAGAIALIAVIGATLHALQTALPGALPTWVLAAMPARLVNVAELAAPGLFLGAISHRLVQWTAGKADPAVAARRLTRAVAIVTLVSLGTIGASARDAWRGLADETNNPFWLEVHDRSRMLAVGAGLGDIQLVAGRPVLLEPAWIDMLPYVPDAAAGINRALRDVYGIDLAHPPANSLTGAGELPSDAGRALWESRTPDAWRVVAARWGFTHVIVSSDWTLTLPLVAEGEECRLYAIAAPDRQASR